MPFEDEIEPKIDKIRRRWGFLNRFLPESIAKLVVDIEWAKEQRKEHHRISDECEELLEELRELELVLDEQIEEFRETLYDSPEVGAKSLDDEISQTEFLLDRLLELDEKYLTQNQAKEVTELSQELTVKLEWFDEYQLVAKATRVAKQIRKKTVD